MKANIYNPVLLAMSALGVLALPSTAGAQSNAELLKDLQVLKERIQQIETQMQQSKEQSIAPAEFERVRTKIEAVEDSSETAGFKGLRISGGIDPTYISSRNKNTRSFAFLNNSSGGDEVFSSDNSYSGLAYLDIQKEMDDGGTKFRLTLAPHKSAGSVINGGSIVHEASASIPLGSPSTRLLVGQMPDVSGYQPFFNSFSGANSISTNQLYPGYGESFVTKNLLFDFAAGTAYTGLGLDITQGPWNGKVFLANFNAARLNSTGAKNATKTPMFIYNGSYAKNEYWGLAFTGYEGKATNWSLDPSGATASRLSQLEVDGWWTRGDFNSNLQFTLGRQKDAALNGGDASWYGLSYLSSLRLTSAWTVAGRLDYLNNQKNGGGTFAVGNSLGSTGLPEGTLGDVYNGFGPGDPNAAGYDVNKGANRYALSGSVTYRYTRHVAFRAELRHDRATTPAFYNFSNDSFTKSNSLLGLQTIINF